MATVLLDTHSLYWWATDPERLSPAAGLAISAAGELVVSDITWFELAWLVAQRKIGITMPVAAWLTSLATTARTVGITPSIAATAVALPRTFPADPADRLIFATAIEHGWPLVTKDRLLREHGALAPGVIW